MPACTECGLLEKKSSSFYCHRFEKEINPQALGAAEDCLYFCRPIYEEGEPLTPRQHLLMQNKDFKSKKMRGPV